MQPDFLLQKSAIEEHITDIRENLIGHRILFYPKFYYKLNHIKYFFYNGKSWTRKNCKYSIEGLREDIPRALKQVKSFTILGHYNSYFKKIELY